MNDIEKDPTNDYSIAGIKCRDNTWQHWLICIFNRFFSRFLRWLRRSSSILCDSVAWPHPVTVRRFRPRFRPEKWPEINTIMSVPWTKNTEKTVSYFPAFWSTVSKKECLEFDTAETEPGHWILGTLDHCFPLLARSAPGHFRRNSIRRHGILFSTVGH